MNNIIKGDNMNLQVARNVMTVLGIVSKKAEMPEEAVKDIDEFMNFFSNILSDIDKELIKKDEVAKDKAEGREFIYPLRLQV